MPISPRLNCGENKTVKKLAIFLIIVLGCTALAFAAAKTAGTVVDASPSAKPAVESTDTGATPATGHEKGIQPKPSGHPTPAREGAKSGNIIIRGKAGSVTSISYGDSTKPEAGEAKTSGQ